MTAVRKANSTAFALYSPDKTEGLVTEIHTYITS